MHGSHSDVPHNDAFVLTTNIEMFDVKLILVDKDNSSNTCFIETLERLGKIKEDAKNINFPIFGFIRRATHPMGEINLPFVLGKDWKRINMDILFIMMDAPLSYYFSMWI